MTNGERLNEITIVTPCPMDWDQMSGDDSKRYCSSCGKHVHDVAKLTSAQAVSLIDQLPGDVCGRITHLADGTLVTADSRFAAEQNPPSTPWQFNIRSLMGIIAGFAATLGLGRLLGDYMEPAPLPPRTPIRTTIAGKLAFRPLRPAATQPTNNQSVSQPGCPASIHSGG
jgi:hypothetical protein